ncbi:hypothetical protein TTHERM_00633339 (macronuclear) [Tetrahymena thermophila SB210]|uniref:Transmembrane protein n=1 Tax=Tetrahymena thermophila (strain SB210) TaxID=312017 RepID=X1W3T1_TETTS|nr:hypothetical protein TTHERM_00633339 [Tetrahymena thermophila SB210]EDK31928.1 hypothetical protein TTHERM_00633339 [Tetrahymena thermophila SB210]|eukprot:XP_001471202.1 hypothetical protein TTHERM_00633339 [Tetrahymena thermophila SB210]
MKIIVLLLVVLQVIAVNAIDFPTNVPSWTTQEQFNNFATCMKQVISGDPCAKSSNQASCISSATDYLNCWAPCFWVTDYTSFKTCQNSCDNKAKSADQTLVSYVNSSDQCFGKLNSSLLALSAFILAAFSLLF